MGPARLDARGIAERFARVRPLVERVDIVLREPPDVAVLVEPDARRARVEAIAESIAEVLERRPGFAARFDYGWATDPDGYDDVWDAVLQHVVIVTLSEIDDDHPDLERLNPVVVKSVRSVSFASVCVPGADVDFICISRAFQGFLQAFVGTLLDLRDAARGLDDTTATWCRGNALHGRDAERALRAGGDETEQLVDTLLGSAMRLSAGRPVRHARSVGPRLYAEIERVNPFLAEAYLSCEGFVVCHELAHLLRRHRFDVHRDVRREREADQAALSLMTIASACVEWMATGLFAGPALFIQVSRVYDLGRRVQEGVDAGHVDMETIVPPADELTARGVAIVRAIPGLGTPPVVQQLVQQLIDELHVILAACQRAVLRELGHARPFADFLPEREAFVAGGFTAQEDV